MRAMIRIMGDTAEEEKAPLSVTGLRIEEWLLALATALRDAPLSECALAYDDRFQGERLALTLRLPESACELQVSRQVRTRAKPGKAGAEPRGAGAKEVGATLILLAQGEHPAALELLVDRAAALHRGISRLRNARRKFIHRVLRMGRQLLQRREALGREYPQEALERLRGLLPEAAPLVGVEGRFRAGGSEGDDDDGAEDAPAGKQQGASPLGAKAARAQRRYPARFGAWIPAGAPASLSSSAEGVQVPRVAGRAALYAPGSRSFLLPGTAARLAAQALQQRAAAQGEDAGPASLDPTAFAIRNPAPELRGLLLAGTAAAAALAVAPALSAQGPGPQQAGLWDRLSNCDVGDVCDVLDCLDVLPDIGSCDLPDCNSCDLPDLSCDVGSCDLPSCDL